MKKKIFIGYIGISTGIIIVLLILLLNMNNEKKDLEVSLSNITPEVTQVMITPKQTKEPTYEPIFTPFVTEAPTPTRTPYEPTEEDLAFKESVIAEGRTITLEISEWDMIDIFCNKTGRDEYKYRFREINEDGIYYLVLVDLPPAANYVWYGLEQSTGNIVDSGAETVEPLVWGNIFYNEVKDEPRFRFTDEEYIDIFVERILKLDKIPNEIDIYVRYTQMGEMYFETINKIDRKIWVEYYVHWGTWEVWDFDDEIFYGTLFD